MSLFLKCLAGLRLLCDKRWLADFFLSGLLIRMQHSYFKEENMKPTEIRFLLVQVERPSLETKREFGGSRN